MIGPPCGAVGSVFLPLGGEDAVEQRVRGAAAFCWLQGEHILQNIEGKLFWRLTDQRSFGKGCPLLLQSSLSTNVVLKHPQRKQTLVFLLQRSIFSSAGCVYSHLADLGHPGDLQVVYEAELFPNFTEEEVELPVCWVQ